MTPDSASDRVERTSIRDQVRDILLTWLTSGVLEPGSNLSETELAEQLGASRTPVREALFELALDGLVTREPGWGFKVSPLTQDEGGNLFEVAGALETWSLRTLPLPTDEQMDELRRLDREREAAVQDTLRQLDLDREWHRVLQRNTANPVLQETLDRLRNRLYRYQRTFMQREPSVRMAIRQHREIVAALESGDRERASDLLWAHWVAARDAVLAELPKAGEGGATPEG